MDGDAVACLLIRLCVGLDGEDAVDLPLIEALQPQTLPRHQAADAPTALYNALDAACCQCVGDILSHTTAAGIAPGKAEIDAVADARLFISLFRGFLDKQNAGTFCSMIGQRCLTITGGETAGGLRLSRLPGT